MKTKSSNQHPPIDHSVFSESLQSRSRDPGSGQAQLNEADLQQCHGCLYDMILNDHIYIYIHTYTHIYWIMMTWESKFELNTLIILSLSTSSGFQLWGSSAWWNIMNLWPGGKNSAVLYSDLDTFTYICTVWYAMFACEGTVVSVLLLPLLSW